MKMLINITFIYIDICKKLLDNFYDYIKTYTRVQASVILLTYGANFIKCNRREL